MLDLGEVDGPYKSWNKKAQWGFEKTYHCLHIVYILIRLKKALEDSNGN
jgi:hypothetical protein